MIGKFKPNETITLFALFSNQDGTRALLKLNPTYEVYNSGGQLITSGSMDEIGTERIYHKDITIQDVGNYFVIYKGILLGSNIEIEGTDTFIVSDEMVLLANAISQIITTIDEINLKVDEIQQLLEEINNAPVGNP